MYGANGSLLYGNRSLFHLFPLAKQHDFVFLTGILEAILYKLPGFTRAPMFLPQVIKAEASKPFADATWEN